MDVRAGNLVERCMRQAIICTIAEEFARALLYCSARTFMFLRWAIYPVTSTQYVFRRKAGIWICASRAVFPFLLRTFASSWR